MNNCPLGVWRRFLAVFTPTFILRLNKEATHGKSWGFWFLSNFFLAIIPTIAIGITGYIMLKDFPENAINKIPAEKVVQLSDGNEYNIKNLVRNFEFSITEAKELTSKNVPDPFILSVNAAGDTFFMNNINDVETDKSEFVFMLDTKSKDIAVENLSVFKSGFFLLHDSFISKESNGGATKIMNFQELFNENETITYPLTFNLETIANAKPIFSNIFYWLLAITFLIGYFIIAVIRLIPILFWTLIFWGLGAMIKIKNWDFQKSFMGMLHLSFIPMLFWPLQLILDTWLLCPIVLILLFSANFWEIKRNQ